MAQNSEEEFTARQIAQWIVETYPTECREKQKRSEATIIPLDTQTALFQQASAEISSQRLRLKKNIRG